MLSRFLKSIDFMSVRPTFYVHKQQRFQTIYGGLAMIILFFMYVGGIVYFAKDIYLKENPIVLEYSHREIDIQDWEIQTEDFAINFALKDPHTYEPYINESIYTVEFVQNVVSSGKITKSRKMNLLDVVCKKILKELTVQFFQKVSLLMITTV